MASHLQVEAPPSPSIVRSRPALLCVDGDSDLGRNIQLTGLAPFETERRVRFDHEDLDGVRMMVRSEIAELHRGDLVDVEVGARWMVQRGHQERVPGVWVRCEVLNDTGRELVVKLLPG